MHDPVLVEITRGTLVESRHRGAVAIVDGMGKTVLALGDVDSPVFPRSAVKALQALPLIESGIADHYGLSEAELALAIASHSGEPEHAATAAAILNKAGRDAACLECGAHWPMSETAARALAGRGEKPTALHNNCSGKHAGFICLACGSGDEVKGYIRPDHPVQQRLHRTLEEMTGVSLPEARMGIDGCSIPTWAAPLRAFAHAFAKLATGQGLDPTRAQVAERLRRAAAAHPVMVAGSRRFDTLVMQKLGLRAFVKTGAEGVYCAALPELGYGLALKCADGATRGAEMMMAQLLISLLALENEDRDAILNAAKARLTNWNGMAVGALRASSDLTQSLKTLN
jgi:L-asparaginase II